MEAKCVVCHDKAAAFRCIQCHKPVCDECAHKDENGAFCSRECAGQYRSYAQVARKAAAKKGSLGKVILLVILLAVAAFIAWKRGLLPSSITDRLPGGAENSPAEAPASVPE